MKKLLTFLTLLTLFFGVGWAETATLPGTQALTTSFAYVGTDTHIKIKTSDANSYTNPIRIYANNTVTIAADDGYVLKSVKYEASSTGNYVTYAQNATVSPNVTPTVSGKYVTWTFTTNPTEFTFTPSSQTRCSSMVITYEKQATDPPTPPTAEIIFNPTTNSTIEIGSTVNFTLNGTATGIKYTTDNTNPGANNGTIGSSVTLNGNAGDQITIKAVAFNQNSAGTAYGTIYTATYTLKTSTSKTYQRITSTDDLEIGEKYIIIYSTSATNIYANVLGSNTPSGTTRPYVTKDISEDRKITVDPNDAIAQFTLGGGPDAYTLLCDNGSYLNGQSSSQYLKINGDGTDNYSKWNITFDGNYAKINNKGNTSYYVSWHTYQHYFNLYTSYTGIYLYKEYIPKAYNVAVTQAEGGTITASPVGEKVVDAGDKITVTATASPGYELTGWTITGANESAPDANNQITATGNVTITATFSKIQYSITNVVKTNGEVSGDGGTLTNWTGVSTVNGVWGAKLGDEISFRADTYNGYQIREENISITDASGNAVTFTFNNNVVTFTMPASNVTITANYTYYRPKIRLAGRYNTTNSSAWVNTNVGPQFVYDSDNDRYTLDVFFATPSSNFFYLFVDGNATWPTSGGNWSVTDTTGTATAVSWNGGDGNEFEIAPGIFNITIAGDMSKISFKAIVPTVSLTPDGSSNVEAGSSVTVSSNLTTLLDGIVSGTTATLATSTDNTNYTDGATYTMPLTAGSVTLYGKAYYGAIVVTTPATIYTVVKANTSNKYQLVSDINSMESGKKYLIVSKGNYTSYGNTYNYEVAATGISGTVLGGEDIDIVDNIITLSSNSNVVPYVMNLSSGKWSFMNSNTNEYLTFTDPSSGSGTVSTGSTGTAFTLNSINSTSGNADLALSNSKLYFNPNSGNYRFTTYKNAQKSVMLFKQMVEEVKDYTITYAEVTGGSATGADGANEGETVTVTVTASEGYAATGITVNPSVEVTDNGDGTYSFTMPASDVTVTPSFAQAYDITYVAEPAAGGLVTGVASAVYDARVEVTVTPNADYQLSGTPTYTYNGITQQLAGAGTAESPYYFNMPGYATTVTANFVKIPHGITVVSTHGDVTGIPATATSGTSVTFTVTPNAGYVVSSVSGTFNNGNSSLDITDNGDGTYTFNMPASDVAITVTYFASEDYELLTDLADINEEDTYLIVGGPAANTDKVNVMGKATDNSTMGYVALTTDNYVDGIITSSANMAVVNFLVGTGDNAGKYALHTSEGYITTSSVKGTSPYYMSIELNDDSRAFIGSHFSYNSSSPRWKYYTSQPQGANYIFKLANKNKVKRPSITGAAGEFLGQYNFIGKDNVSMACATDGATIEYSLDGGTTWLTYSEAFEITTNAAGNTVEVQARATKTGMEPSEVVTATFTCIKPTAPTFGTNEAGAYVNPVFVYPKSALNDRRAYGEESVSFCYTTDGTDANALSMEVATSNSNGYYIVLDDNATLSVVTVINGIASDPAGGAYTFSVDAPTFSLAGGNYDGNQQTRLSTGTKTQQNNLSWNTVIYYTTGNTEFAFNATTGEVTSEGWVAYDPTNSPYIDILAANGTTTIKAVTLSNYFNGQSEYRASDVTTETYVLTAANLSITISPAAGTYVNAQNVTLGVKNNIGDYIIYYTTDGSDPNTNGTEYTGTPITVDHDMTIKVYAIDSRTGDGGTATAEATYKIGIQPVVYSPFPGTVYKGDNEDINVEMFSVTPNAKIYYTVAEGEDNLPTDPTTSSTLYSEPIPLETGKVYNFKAIAVIGSLVSTVTPGTFTVQAKGSGWLNVYEMANSSQGTSKTLENPVQVVYMSKYRNGDTSVDYPGEPEFCFVRDNSGYGLIYFGAGNIAAYENFKVFEMGDWLEGGKIAGSMANWNSSFINELGGGASTSYRVTSWPSASLGNTAILPEETTNKAITDGWTYNGAYTGSDYEDYIDPDKNLFGHYVHMRKNTISNVSGAGGGNGKHAGIITDQSGVPLNYYDGFYLFSGYNNDKDYDQTFFNNIQSKGGTFDVYAIVQFYGPNANNSSYSNAPYEIFPIDFEWIYKPLFNIESGTYYEPQTISLTCETEGAQIWYKTSEMEAYELYTGPFEVDVTTTIEAYSTLPSKYNDVLESVINSITVTIGTVDAPVITEPSVVKTVDESVTTDITCTTEGATIYYTTDGSDPKTSETRIEYTLGQQLTFDETTTVRAIAMQDGYYSVEAESRTYTFVKSNGIEYTLVTNVNQLNENSVYVIVNKANNMAMSTNQKTNNRGAAGVMFKNADKTIVYGNDDLAQFTLKKTGNNWYIQTNNSNENGYLSVGNGNTLLTSATADGNAEATITIDGTNANVDKANEAHISFIYNNETTRYMRYWNRDLLFNTYTTETNAPVFLYYIEATPLATIEKDGINGNDYTVADELVGVYASGKLLWCKDQGNVSINKSELNRDNGEIDFLHDVVGNPFNTAWEDCDQSNWVILDFSDVTEGKNDAEYFVNKFIAPATVTGTYNKGTNYTIKLKTAPNDNAGSPSFTKNIFVASSFAEVYQAGVNNRRFLNPKGTEVHTLTFAVWDGANFTTPSTTDLPGVVSVDWTYNESDDVSQTLVVGTQYEFIASVGFAAASNSPGLKAEAQTSKTFKVQPLNLTSENVITGINTIAIDGSREVKSVKYVNVAGIVSDRPFQGVNIVVTEYTDGSRTTSKMLRK